ncbi:hypothetical protein NUU61_000226 [Penicillium alfredii]|uniref:Uncharacterized protein n=1 Tax=Penicillium alfredii TaxID=1506179 RepID=A0A9W9KQP9_9EURO|nr:uncharacterized protein NUU61_000226 [Penicillium alfredii]KAJ5114467.1 hypothetical protein NUU61_000226 [Penicillium alfredii]
MFHAHFLPDEKKWEMRLIPGLMAELSLTHPQVHAEFGPFGRTFNFQGKLDDATLTSIHETISDWLENNKVEDRSDSTFPSGNLDAEEAAPTMHPLDPGKTDQIEEWISEIAIKDPISVETEPATTTLDPGLTEAARTEIDTLPSLDLSSMRPESKSLSENKKPRGIKTRRATYMEANPPIKALAPAPSTMADASPALSRPLPIRPSPHLLDMDDPADLSSQLSLAFSLLQPTLVKGVVKEQLSPATEAASLTGTEGTTHQDSGAQEHSGDSIPSHSCYATPPTED